MNDNPISTDKLRWQCRRGMLELDVLLERYLRDHYADDAPSDQQRFRTLLAAQDPDLQRWLLSNIDHPDPGFGPLVSRIRNLYSR